MTAIPTDNGGHQPAATPRSDGLDPDGVIARVDELLEVAYRSLYVSPAPRPMAGLLIYTAAGDAEGTMGGLVRMGRPEHLTRITAQALEGATWCSADPVCMEVGSTSGQGPDSCNLAACHNCALVPETACEQFNRFLDRGLVVGTIEDRGMGYFDLPAPASP